MNNLVQANVFRGSLADRLRGVLYTSGLNVQQWNFISAIGKRSLTAGELSKKICIAESSLSRIIKSLESVGLTKTEIKKEDGRIKYVSLTDYGISMHDKHKKLASKALRLTKSDKDFLRNLIGE